MWKLAAIFAGALMAVNYLEKCRKEKSIYDAPRVVRLAEACKNGDASAMRKMAEVLRNHCEAETKELLARYEADPTPEHASAIYENQTCMGKGYMMWLVRAAFYKDAKAAEKLAKCPVYKELAFIPYGMMSGEEKPRITFWNSATLYDIGFIDVPQGYTDCSLLYDPNKKIYDLCYVSDYEPPDEDGFGAEWDYDDMYFDEFFRRVWKRDGN